MAPDGSVRIPAAPFTCNDAPPMPLLRDTPSPWPQPGRIRVLLPILLLLVPAGCEGGSDGVPDARAEAPEVQVDRTDQGLPDPAAFTEVLRHVVDGALVDYARLQENRAGLDAWIRAQAETDPADLEAAPESHQLAFWINAYNSCMLRIVIDHYPIEAGGAGFFGRIVNRVADRPENSVWQIRDVFGRDHCPVAGEDRSQDEIEHDIIRPDFQEPRIHFAVNCAARSCPVLAADAYHGDHLEEQLEQAVEVFMENPDHFRVEVGDPPVLRLNKVLDWYSEDFGGVDALPAFFRDRVGHRHREALESPGISVEFFEYDWTLNDTAVHRD